MNKLLIILALLSFFILTAFIMVDSSCNPDNKPGAGEWINDPDGCWYIHTDQEFDDDSGCDTCHNEPADVYDFKPDLRIRDGQVVSVIEINGFDCTLFSGEVVDCRTVIRPPMMWPLPQAKYARNK